MSLEAPNERGDPVLSILATAEARLVIDGLPIVTYVKTGDSETLVAMWLVGKCWECV